MTQPIQVVGNYEFLGIVDKPRAGVTHKVRNLSTGEIEALRMLPGAAYGDPESLGRFLREIKIHTRLSHPNVVAFHDAWQMDGRLVMTTEYVEGTTLAQMCRRGPLPSDLAIRAICDVLLGLDEAHSLGIVHRGITAEHVTITPDGRVKLGGFGLAKPALDVNLTQAGAVVGDPRYMSPEQVTGITTLDSRADIYSVGVLLFEALTGRVPFEGENDFDIMAAQVSTEPRRPSSWNPAVSPELDRIVLTALAKNPGRRFSTAKEFRVALAALNGPVRVTAQAGQQEDTPVETAPPRFLVQGEPSGRPKMAFVLGFVGIAAGLIILLIMKMH